MLRRSLITTTALLILVAPAGLSAQEEVVGDWDGMIAGQLQMIFHITATDGALAATLDVPMQNAAGLPMDSVTFDGTKLRLTMDMIGGVYEGTLLEDGTIEGQWSQTAAPQPQALNLKRMADDS